MINVKFQGELRSVSLKEFTKRDGSKGYDYPVLVETADSSYSLKTTVDVYNRYASGELKKGDVCDFSANFEPRFQFNNFTITDAKVVK